MKYVVDHDLHIHSGLSSCSADPEQNPARILQYAKDFGLKTVCITDHFWDETVPGASKWYQPQNFAHITQNLPLPQAEGIRFFFGCETDMFKDMTVGLAKGNFDRFDFVIIPIDHFHMKKESLPEEYQTTPEKRAEFWAMKLEALLNMDLPFHKIGIAHLAASCIAPTSEERFATLDAIPQQTLDRLFQKAAALGCGIELNQGDFNQPEDKMAHILRIFRTAKKQGCKFYCGSDAHHPAGLESAPAVFARAVNLLDLTEEDKLLWLK